MGNSAAKSEDDQGGKISIPEEPSWNLPSEQLDTQWLRACMDEMFDAEKLQRSFRGSEMRVVDARRESVINVDDQRKTPNRQDGHIPEKIEAELVADAIACLAFPYDSQARANTVTRLTSGLTLECREEDDFTTAVSQRLHFLKCMHAAMRRTWRAKEGEEEGGMEEEPEVAEVTKKEETVEVESKAEEEPSAAGLLPSSSTDEAYLIRRKKKKTPRIPKDTGLPHTVQLGIQMFFTVLDVLETAENVDYNETLSVAREIIPLFHNLAPQSLSDQRVLDMADTHMSTDQQALFMEQHMKILDRLVGFFFRCAGNSLSYSNGVPQPVASLEIVKPHVNSRKNNNRNLPDSETRDSSMHVSVPSDLRARSLEALFALACCRTGFYELVLTILLLLTEAKRSLEVKCSRSLGKSQSEKALPSALKPKPALGKWRQDGSSRKNGGNQDGGKQEDEDSPGFGVDPLLLHSGLKHLSSVSGKYVVDTSMLEKGKEQVELWSCGQNSYGELAHGNTVAQKSPTKAKITSGRNIVQIAAGNEHTITLTTAGHVYTVGYNDNGQCGHGNKSRVSQLSLVEALKGKRVVQVHAYNGCEHTFCVTDEGELYSFGYNYRGQLGHGTTSAVATPTLVHGFGPSFRRRVEHVSCSYYHSVVADDRGDLFAFGRNDFGQLGLGDATDRLDPTVVQHPYASKNKNGETEKLRVVAVTCGQYHTVVTFSDGSVCSCGKNDYGQLGLELPEPHLTLSNVRRFGVEAATAGEYSPEDVFIVDVRSGYYHTLALGKSGCLWSFGRNDYGQLGLGHATQKIFGASQVEDLDGRTVRIVRIATGCYHSVAVDETGTVYVFGRNNHGQLGCGDLTERHSPWPIKRFASTRIGMVAAGFYHTIVLTGGVQLDPSREETQRRIPVSSPKELTHEYVLQGERFSGLPFESALEIMAQVDRLGSAYQAKIEEYNKAHGVLYLPLIPRADDDRALPRKVAYCVDASPKAFKCLLDVLELCKTALNRLHSVGPAQGCQAKEMDEFFWEYLLLATLKLIKVNMNQVLLAGIGPAMYQVACSKREAGSYEEQLSQMMHKVHESLLSAIEFSTSLTSSSATKIQEESANALISGLELFYPTQEQQVQLLASLMAEREPPSKAKEKEVLKHRPSSARRWSPRSPLVKFQADSSGTLSPSPILRKLLLEPLLKRLADDELVSAIVPYWTSAVRCHDKMKPMTPYARGIVLSVSNGDDAEASVALLYSLLTSVVRQVASQSTMRFRAFMDGQDPERMPLPGKANGFLRLLMSLQKHLLSWAASKPFHATLVTQKASNDYVAEMMNSISSSMSMSNPSSHDKVRLRIQIPKANEEEVNVFPWRKRVGIASGWDCLLRYSENVMKQAIQELSGCLKPALEDVQVSFASASAVLEETCLSSKLLPSLIVGLSLFAEETFFAVRLLPRVAELLRVLNDTLCSVPCMIEADEEYCKAFEEQGTQGSKGPNGRRDTKPAPALPWLLELFKSVASLSGRLSATLILGREDEQRLETSAGPDANGDQDMYEFWKESELFQGGLDPEVLPSRFFASGSAIEEGFFDKLDATPDATSAPQPVPDLPVSPQKLQKQLSSSSLSSLSSGTPRNVEHELKPLPPVQEPADGVRLLDREALLCFVDLTASNRGDGKTVVDSLREVHTSRNVQYKMALLQGRGNGGADAQAMERVECATLAALLKHTNDDGVLFDAVNFARGLAKTPGPEVLNPPVRLMECWRAAAEVRMNLLRLRTHLSGDSSGAFTTLCESHRMRANFLLMLEPTRPLPNVSTLRVPPARSGKILWRKLAIYVAVCSRWKKATARGYRCAERLQQPASVALKPSVQMVLRFIQNPADQEDPDARVAGPSSPKKSSSPTKRKQQALQKKNAAFSLGVLFQKMAYAWRQAHLRALGLTSFRSLLAIPKLSSPRVDILRFLAPALSAATAQKKAQVKGGEQGEPLARHYASGLNSVGKGMMQLVHDRFMSLYRDLALSLREAVDGESAIYAQERLLLFDAWALTLTPGDLHLLSETGLLVTLQRSLALAVSSDEELGKRGGQRGKASPGGAKSKGLKKHRQQQVAKAAWTLFRLLLTQVGEGIDEAQVASLLDVLYDESRAVLRKLEERVKSGSVAGQKGGPVEPAQHLQTLVDAPQQLVNMQNGLHFKGGDVIGSGEGGSFTMSMWVRLEQDSTGSRRVIVLRNNTASILPIVVVRGDDRRVEVWRQGKVDDGSREHLVSKTQLKLHAWTHIAVVYEDGRLALFVDGGHEAEDDLPEVDGDGCSGGCLMDVWVGKPAGVGLAGVKVRGGMEGKIARLKLHARALSPIHIRIMFDQGPPVQEKADDQRCFQLIVLQQGLTNSSLGKRCLVRPQWLQLQAEMLKAGTLRVRQAVLRLWRVLLPTMPLADTATPLLAVLAPNAARPAAGLIDFMLNEIGQGLWCSQSKASEESEADGDACGLASELIMLLRLLLSKAEDWRSVIARRLELAISSLIAFDSKETSRAIGALAVLGGHMERLRVGGRVAMTHTDITATVVSLDVDPASPEGVSALVVMSADEEGNDQTRQKQESQSATGAFKLLAVQKAMKRQGRSSRAVRINVDELVPIAEFAPPLVSEKQGLEQLEEAFYELLAGLLEMSSGGVGIGIGVPTGVDQALFEQTLSSTLQVLHGVLDCYEKEPSRFFARMTPRAGQWGVLQRLFAIAGTVSPSHDFLTLDGLRSRSVQLRERLYRLSGLAKSNEPLGSEEEMGDLLEFVAAAEESIEESGQMEVLSEGDQLQYLFAQEESSRLGSAQASVSATEENGIPQVLVEELASMGFAHEWCVAALRVCGGDFVAASTWIVDHLDLLRTTPLEELVAESGSSVVRRFNSDAYDYAEDLEDEDGEGSEDNEAAGSGSGSGSAEVGVGVCTVAKEAEGLTITKTNEDKEEEHQQVVDQAKKRTSSSIAALQTCAQLEMCLGQQVFNENYFANDSAASYSYGYSCGALSLYNGAHAENRGIERPCAAEVCALSSQDLLQRCTETERQLSVVLARACVLTLLLRWRQWPTNALTGHAKLGTFDLRVGNLCAVLKMLLFRGPQIMPSVDVSILVRGEAILDPFFWYDMPGLARIRPAIKGSIADQLFHRPSLGRGFAETLPVSLGSSTHDDEKNESTAAAMGAGGSVLRLMLDCISPALVQMLREEVAEGRSRIARRLLETALQEVEGAACAVEDVDESWGMRDLSMSDTAAVEKPCVEWGMWVLGLLLLEGISNVFSVAVFTRLSALLGSSNMPIKALAMQMLCGIVSQWLDTKSGGELEDEERRRAVRLLPRDRLAAFAQEMYTKEIGSGRGIASKFTAALAELTYLLQQWESVYTDVEEDSPRFDAVGSAVHEGRKCTGCGEARIRGTCYVSVSVSGPEQVFCELCEPDVVMDTSINPPSRAVFKLKQPLRGFELPMLELGRCEDAAMHTGVCCAACGVKDWSGVRFACIACGKDYCSRCEIAHPVDHVLVKMDAAFPEYKSSVVALVASQRPAIEEEETAVDVWITSVEATSISLAISKTAAEKAEATVHVVNESAGVSEEYRVGGANWYRVDDLSPSTSYTVYVSIVTGGQEVEAKEGNEKCLTAVESKHTSVRTIDVIPFRLDSGKSGSDISVSGDGLRASYTAVETWSTILGSSGFISGRNSWEVVVEASSTSYLFIGVAEMTANLATFLGGDDKGWGYIGDQAIYHGRTKLRAYGERFKEKDRIGVTLDMDAGTLSFSKNGTDLGVAIEGLTGKLYPAFAFYNCGQQISLIPDKFQCSLGSSSLSFDPAECRLNTLVRDNLDLLCAISSRSQFSQASIDRAYDDYCAWLSMSKAYCKSKLGVVVAVDCSPEAFESLNVKRLSIRRNTRVKTCRGLGRAIGVLDGRLWVQHDDENDAWFVRTDEGITVVEATADDDQDSKRQLELFSMSKKDFARAVASESWRVLEDEAIVSQASTVAGRQNRNAFALLPGDVVERVLPSAQQDVQLKLRRNLLNGEDNGLRNPLASLARFVMLRLLNLDLQNVLPLACGSIGGSTHGVAFGALDAIPMSTSLGQKTRQCRGLIFELLKKKMIGDILLRTVTAAKRGEDEYEYPEELPQLTMNRAKAAFSRVSGDAETRLSHSLFGQAFDELHFLEPRILRMAYSHPMDEGQSRAFRVKFEGEGVDDYGGPYREVFTQWASELTATTLSEDGSADKPTPDFADNLHAQDYASSRQAGGGRADGNGDGGQRTANTEEDSGGAQEGVKCVLPLFHPCPNRQHGVGANRDQVVLKPSSSVAAGSGAHLLMEMYNFIGQLAGIALRTKTHLNLDLAQLVWKPLVAEGLDMDDLREIDRSFVTMMEKIQSARDEELVVYSEELTWTSTLSDGTEVELIPGGAQIQVQMEHLEDYVKIVVHKRLKESERALRALRDGLTSVVPHAVLPLFTGKELQRLLAGAPIISIDLLQQCTEYEDDLSSEDPHIQSFWRVLESFSPIHRSRFLRFVWARSSLPATASEFPQKFKIQSAIGEGPRESPDEWLPKAHTCFFSLSLPRYSSDTVMREKLLYAIHNCLEMDADFRLTESEMTGWD